MGKICQSAPCGIGLKKIHFFAREALISGEARFENLGKIVKNMEAKNLNQGVVSSNREYSPGPKIIALL